MLKILAEFPRWALLLAIIYAPWLWGSIPVWTQWPLVFFCLGFTVWHLVVRLALRRWSWPPWPLMLAMGVTLGLGWWMTYNAKYIAHPILQKFINLPQPFPDLPGSANQTASSFLMWRVSAWWLVLWMVWDIGRDPVWRQRILGTMALCGIALITFGHWQKLLGVKGLWPEYGKNIYPFATFYYHGNAGAYINLVLPLVWAFLLISFTRARGRWMRPIWLIGLCLTLAGAAACASKGALLISILLSLIMLIPTVVIIRQRLISDQSSRVVIAGGVFMSFVIVTLIWMAGTQASQERWQHALHVGEKIYSERLEVAKVMLRMTREGGWHGWGPHTFSTVFPAAAKLEGKTFTHIWLYGHQDYLQTAAEWGWLGATAWLIPLAGGLGLTLWAILRQGSTRQFWHREGVLKFATGTAVLGCASHAIFDFPMQITAINFYVIILCGLLWAFPQSKKKIPKEPVSS